MFLVIALEFLRKLIKKVMQKFRQALNDDKESLGELEDLDEIKNVNIRVSIMLVSEDVSSDLNENELGS